MQKQKAIRILFAGLCLVGLPQCQYWEKWKSHHNENTAKTAGENTSTPIAEEPLQAHAGKVMDGGSDCTTQSPKFVIYDPNSKTFAFCDAGKYLPIDMGRSPQHHLPQTTKHEEAANEHGVHTELTSMPATATETVPEPTASSTKNGSFFCRRSSSNNNFVCKPAHSN